MRQSRPQRTNNKLLARLPAATSRQITKRSDEIELQPGDTLSTAGELMRNVYFLTSGLASLVAGVNGHSRVDVALVGDEGMVGVSLVLGVLSAQQTATVRCAGTAWRMPAKEFAAVLSGNEALRERLNLYVYVCMGQLSQSASCTHYHTLEARLARWLLVARDRLGADSFLLTHESLAHMLGVRRAGVTGAASALREQGLIRYTRGAIVVVNRAGLERAACGCYAHTNDAYIRVRGR